RTSNALDRLMNHQDRRLYAMRYLHGTPDAARLAVRAMALQWNSTPTGLARAVMTRLVALRSTTSTASSTIPTGSTTCSSPPPWEVTNYEPRNPIESGNSTVACVTLQEGFVAPRRVARSTRVSPHDQHVL